MKTFHAAVSLPPSEAIASDPQIMCIYLEAADSHAPPPPFRSGEAGHVWLNASGEFEQETKLRISANTTHALLGHGVVADLNRLPLMGELGTGLDVVIPQQVLPDATRVLYAADRNTYGGEWEFSAGLDEHGVECRVRIDNREYQRSLARLSDVLTAAGRIGYAAWIRI